MSTYFNNVSSIDALIIQQCDTGAKHVKSSKNGLPKARPWSKWIGKVSLSKILKIKTYIMKMYLNFKSQFDFNNCYFMFELN